MNDYMPSVCAQEKKDVNVTKERITFVLFHNENHHFQFCFDSWETVLTGRLSFLLFKRKMEV